MKWFPSKVIMMHAADNIECPAEHLNFLLKVFSMNRIKIIYDETINNKDDPEAVGIMSINYGKSIGCSLDNQDIEYLITPFITNMVF